MLLLKIGLVNQQLSSDVSKDMANYIGEWNAQKLQMENIYQTGSILMTSIKEHSVP